METPTFEICDAARSLIERAALSTGGHGDYPPVDLSEPCEACVMEVASQVMMLCGFPEATWTDHPSSFDDSPVSALVESYMIGLNDHFSADPRLKDYLPRVLTSKRSPGIENKRMFLVADYAVRIFAPIGLRAANLEESAKSLEACASVVDNPTANAATYAAAAATNAAYAAANAATYAAAAYAAAAYAANAAANATYAAANATYAAANATAAAYAAAAYAANAAANAANAKREEVFIIALRLLDELLNMQ